MATRLSFAEFDAKLKNGVLTPAEYRKTLEVDPMSHSVRVRFKPGALRDIPPLGYDVDREVYFAKRAEQERQLVTPTRIGLKRVVAEGDSWFNLPKYIKPQAIADRLASNKLVTVKNIAYWGDTLSDMLEARQYLTEIPKFDPDWFIFSGGGNDLQQALARGELLQTYDASRPIEQCLSEKGVSLLRKIAEGYRRLLNEIAVAHPTLKSICYAYDYPKPTYKDGKYIGQYLKEMAYPKATWDAVVETIINRLTEVIKMVAKAFPNAQFLDCRGETAQCDFIDDMHPDTDGFKKLASKFENAFGVALVSAGRVRDSLPDAKKARNGKRHSAGRVVASKTSMKKKRTNRRRK